MSHSASGADEDVAFLVERSGKAKEGESPVGDRKGAWSTPEYYGIRESPWEFAWTVT
jgi:hypothetical protein